MSGIKYLSNLRLDKNPKKTIKLNEAQVGFGSAKVQSKSLHYIIHKNRCNLYKDRKKIK